MTPQIPHIPRYFTVKLAAVPQLPDECCAFRCQNVAVFRSALHVRRLTDQHGKAWPRRNSCSLSDLKVEPLKVKGIFEFDRRGKLEIRTLPDSAFFEWRRPGALRNCGTDRRARALPDAYAYSGRRAGYGNHHRHDRTRCGDRWSLGSHSSDIGEVL